MMAVVGGAPATGEASPRARSTPPCVSTKQVSCSAAAPVLLHLPLLSPGRVPEALQGLQATRTLDSALNEAMSAKALGGTSGAAQSCALVAQDGRTLFSYHSAQEVEPASNMKLLTATALLDKLGPKYTFQTEAVASAPLVDGVLDGNLYLVGGGDPLLRLPSYAATITGGDKVYTNVDGLVTALRAAGLRSVTGSVVGDDSRYDAQRSVPSWPARFYLQGDVGELSALSIDDGFALGGPPVPVSALPAQQAAGVLTDLLQKAGVTVGGAPEPGQAPGSTTVLATIRSPPLAQVLGEVLRESDNTAMELLTKELGLKESSTGSTAAGTAAVRADLVADGLPVQGFVNADGSGLSPLDRVTCALLVAVLERAGPDGLLVQDLPVAARSGTLADEMVGTPAAGRVRAKTGTLDHIKALSGWVSPLPGQGGGDPGLGQPVVFSVVLNGLPLTFANPAETAADLTDNVAVDIAKYPKVPALSEYEPYPGAAP